MSVSIKLLVCLSGNFLRTQQEMLCNVFIHSEIQDFPESESTCQFIVQVWTVSNTFCLLPETSVIVDGDLLCL